MASLHLGGKFSHRRKPTSTSPSSPLPQYPVAHLVRCWLSYSALLLCCFIKLVQFQRIAHHAKHFRLQISQFIVALNDTTAPFAYHSVIHIEVVPANTNRGHIRKVPVVPQLIIIITIIIIVILILNTKTFLDLKLIKNMPTCFSTAQNMLISKFVKIRLSVACIKYLASKLVGFRWRVQTSGGLIGNRRFIDESSQKSES